MNLEVTLTAMQAWIFLPLALPIALWACYTDITEFKIKNVTVLALLAGFIVLGPFAMGWDEYAWRFRAFRRGACRGLRPVGGDGHRRG